jgi:hypothetical protein
MTTLEAQFALARNRGVPILGIETLDPSVTASWIQLSLPHDTPLIRWDAAEGMLGCNQAGITALMQACSAQTRQDVMDLTLDPVSALRIAQRLPHSSLIMMYQLTAFWHDVTVAQAIWNCRQPFAADFRTLVILGHDIRPPAMLTHDLIILEEKLPDYSDIASLTRELYESAELPAPDEATLQRIYETVRGLTQFAAEQAIALSLSKSGMEFELLWNHKRRMIEATKGLRVATSRETLHDLGGLSAAKMHIDDLYHGPEAPFLIVYVEEIEKMLAGSNSEHVGDGGVAKDALQVKLTAMEENKWTGMICVGPPGSGKSAFSRAIGPTYGSYTIAMDTGATKDSLVGSSEQAIRAMFKTIRAIGDERVYFVATCNDHTSLRPELKRRYTDGIWYFGMPDDDELASIWSIQKRAFGINDDEPVPNDVPYTGADVRNICRMARRIGRSLHEAAQRIVPISVADPGSIARLEEAADGRFLSASYPGVYRRDRKPGLRRGVVTLR